MRNPLSVLLFLFLATGLRAQNNIVFLLDVSSVPPRSSANC